MINVSRISFRKKRFEQREGNIVANVAITLNDSIILTSPQLVFNVYQGLKLQWPRYLAKGKLVKHFCFVEYEDIRILEQKVIKQYFEQRRLGDWEITPIDLLIHEPEE